MTCLLLVEDNEVNRDMLSRRLNRRGFTVLCAVDAYQALEIAGKEKPDLVLMDMGLPGMDGWEATHHLKTNPLTAAIPVIALTAHAMSEDRDKAMGAGCDDYDTKPVDMDRLLAKIQALLPASLAPAPQSPSGIGP